VGIVLHKKNGWSKIMGKILQENKKFFIIFGLVLLVAAIAWAAAELSGQANAAAADAGDQSLEAETISMDLIKEPKPENDEVAKSTKPKQEPPACDWQLEKNLRNRIKGNNEEYKKVVVQARQETVTSGKVSLKTGDILLFWATSYKDLQQDYASMWDDCNCSTRANLARELAETRLRSAEVTMSEIDKEKLDALKKQQEKMRLARREYVEKAQKNGEISARDKASIQADLIPRTKTLVTKAGELVQKVSGLLQQVQDTAKTGTSGGLMGGFKAITSLSKGGLLQQVQALLSLSQNMLTNAQDLSADAQTLSGS
jgi:hypothetical protein